MTHLVLNRWQVLAVLLLTAGLGNGGDNSADLIWTHAYPIRASAGGLEAEKGTWIRKSGNFNGEAERGRVEWNVRVSGDARPRMRRLRIECVRGVLDSPFLLSDKNYDFRSVPDLVASLVKGAKTDEEKALALRELLIGEGFYFHHSTPLTPDPIHRLTNSGYGYCGIHAQIFNQLALQAGLRSRICGHSYEYGHATNEVYYNGQWHFIDTDAEALFRRPDGVIPSFEEIRQHPELVPPGDAYGQTSFGIDNARYERALYTSPTNCTEYTNTPGTRQYAELDYKLNAGDSITWEWQDADYTKNRVNTRPLYGKGQIEQHLDLKNLARSGNDGVCAEQGNLSLCQDREIGSAQVDLRYPYPVMEVQVSGRTTGDSRQLAFEISRDQGNIWLPLQPDSQNGDAIWRTEIADPDEWAEPADSEKTVGQQRIMIAGHYGYLLRIKLSSSDGHPPVLSDLTIRTTFRQYPPALPNLKNGDNRITYLDHGSGLRLAHVSLEWDERHRDPQLSEQAADWGWRPQTFLTDERERAELPTLGEGPGGTLHLVYAIGMPGSRKIAYRNYRDGQWGAARILTPSNQDANHPVVAEDGNGTVWVAYQTGGQWKGGDVFVLSIDRDRVSRPVRINENDPYHIAFFPSITAQGHHVAVAWEGGQPDVDLRTAWGTEVGWLRIFDGKAWKAPTLVKGEPFKDLGLPKVIYDRSGRLDLTGTKGPRYFRTMAPEIHSFQWLTPAWMYHSRGGALVSGPGGNLWAVFDGQNSGTTNEIYVRMLPARAATTDISHWTPAIRISEDDKRPSIYPDLSTEGKGHVAVVWMDYRDGSPEVFSKLFDGQRWSPDLLLSHGADQSMRMAARHMSPNQILNAASEGLQSEYPHIASIGNGEMWAIWQDKTGENRSRVVVRRLSWK